ncbi:DUF2332 domain-containing protein [Demequina sp. SYSU T00039]|uniref:DUF2332 domain-containing protein n=1 Tax=Demequina lignilytica TaxID=3051663 RepID=A0AAW7M3R1_9MICO|nr:MULTISPECIES: DUF2332 domain-containing protein [unclassified Demequina]MDN4477901.1 DUF2332 domain-containing protein [Demequina sp. SYSU T00039-1]MDN4487810.1 DUF2332 domain-containing protein [Demequina sp. SYSU T00039]
MTDRLWHAGDAAELGAVAEAVRAWAPAAADSPLYLLYATRIADDPELLAVVAQIRSTPPLNVLFAAVQLLLAPDDALAAWYPRLGGGRAVHDGDPYGVFRRFALARHGEILAIARSRTTQTNEVGRCAALLPVVAAEVASRGWGAVHAVDVGAAAGLNLLMDRVAYDYGAARLGEGPFTLPGHRRGGPPVPASVPVIASRTGVDLAPVALDHPENVAWLEALVWPEQTARLDRLRAAVALRGETEVRMIAGDAAEVLGPTLAGLPPGPTVVWHTVALYQAPAGVREAIDDAVEEAARTRPVVRIGMEPRGDGITEVRVGPRYTTAETVALAHAHGAWYDAP